MKRALGVLGAGVLAVALIVVPQPAFAADASYRTLSAARNPDWMGGLASGASLAALSIPGTHETLAIHGGDYVQAQENFGDSAATLTAQLNAGIRMIDIRARVNEGNTFTIHHGATYQVANFDDVLDKLAAFLAAHPGETVIMRLKQECTGETGSCVDASGQNSFPDIFDAYVAARPGLFWAPSVTRASAAAVPTLGAVRGKVVLAVLNGPRGGRFSNYGLAQFSGWNDGSSTYVQDEYNVPSVFSIPAKREAVSDFLATTNAGDPTKLYVNFASGAGAGAPPYWVAGGALWEQGVDPYVLDYLNDNTLSRTGVLMLDFPGGGLINKIISIN
ncbi:phosphatidylinositol-specific phospholipase C [Phytohabitans rumicis]|uniref:phosphatidylinositol-specific phospholipase C n=1 Tax=Phytohabitans rumicis TaxID=1076125 RepID=UPI001FEC872C|nr:phosphatidylinositol-specific phospholipase C [Phytohabitans rumicis]